MLRTAAIHVHILKKWHFFAAVHHTISGQAFDPMSTFYCIYFLERFLLFCFKDLIILFFFHSNVAMVWELKQPVNHAQKATFKCKKAMQTSYAAPVWCAIQILSHCRAVHLHRMQDVVHVHQGKFFSLFRTMGNLYETCIKKCCIIRIMVYK